ncbi:MAG: TIGR03087 family PEP-CTERM/XrtA system glycosyltransferase [Acetobacteraceae bacterium]
MRNLIFISHRLPWPLTKGEKIRGWNLIRHLSKDFAVHLGCVVDDPDDMAHVPHLRELCASVAAVPIDRRMQKLRALLRLRPGGPLMPDFYFAPALQRWVASRLAEIRMDVIYIYSVAMAPYALHINHPLKLLDAQDIDSEKWTQYAAGSRLPMRAVWAREGRTLLAYERRAAGACAATFFVSQPEADRFLELAPELRGKVFAVENGVDLEYYAPSLAFASPYARDSTPVVFTGNMDYWPNVDAVLWFADAVMPLLRLRLPQIAFWIVGANPTDRVRALGRHQDIHVTGRVPDVRPYVANAACAVAPLRIARGIQNKILQGMAMGKIVVATPQAFEGVRAEPSRDLLVADDALQLAEAVTGAVAGLHPGMGESARRAMEKGYAWEAVLAALVPHLEPAR